jgi:hypothetical protein
MTVDPQLITTILIVAIIYVVMKPRWEGYTNFAGNASPQAIAEFRKGITSLNSSGDTVICTVKSDTKSNLDKPSPPGMTLIKAVGSVPDILAIFKKNYKGDINAPLPPGTTMRKLIADFPPADRDKIVKFVESAGHVEPSKISTKKPETGAPIAIAQPVQRPGHRLQGGEKDITALSTFPNCGVIPGSPVKYTLTMTLNIEKIAPGWRNIFIRGGVDSNRRPAIYINPNTLKFHFRHGSTESGNSGIDVTNTALRPGVPTRLAFVNDGKRMSVYVDGIKDTAEYVLPDGKVFEWGADDTAKAAIAPYTANASGYVKVSNLTWYNVALSPEEIKNVLK